MVANFTQYGLSGHYGDVIACDFSQSPWRTELRQGLLKVISFDTQLLFVLMFWLVAWFCSLICLRFGTFFLLSIAYFLPTVECTDYLRSVVFFRN
jgi:hypothetical protein